MERRIQRARPAEQKTLLKVGTSYDEGTSTAYHVVTFTDYVFDENGNRIARGKDRRRRSADIRKLSDVITTYKATWEQTPGDNLFSRSLLNGCFIEEARPTACWRRTSAAVLQW